MTLYNFPPSSEDAVKINQLLQVYSTTINDNNAIYISTPMTSGLLYMNAFAESPNTTSLSADKRKSLFNKNCQHARSVAALTRLHFPTSIVIDPTKIEVVGWEQNDYLTFWRQVIVKYVSLIRFVDNWYYSNGCAYEFLVGVASNKVMVDEQENAIYPLMGRDLIQSAYNEHLKNGYENKFLLDVIDALNILIQRLEDDGA
jgi:hypothetical protein